MISIPFSNHCLLSRHVVQLLLSLLLLSTMSPSLGSTPAANVVRSPRRSFNNVKRRLAARVRSMHLRKTIMQKLNRTQLQPESVRSTEKEEEEETLKNKVDLQLPMETQPAVDARALDLNAKRSNMILSEPFVSTKTNVMKFRLEDWHDVNRLANVLLCINLKPQRRRRRKVSKKKSRKRRKNLDVSDNYKDLDGQPRDSFVCRNNSSCSIRKKSIEKENKEKQLTDKGFTRRKSAKQKRPRVRLVIFALGVSGHRKKKIGSKRTRVVKLYTERMKIPLELIKAAATSDNKVLVLLIRCRRCKGKVKLETIYRKRKTGKKSNRSNNGKKMKMLNPNRPYLLLEYSGTIN